MNTHDFFHKPLSATDSVIAKALADESRRQQDQIELIASENIVSRAVLQALGHPIANKTLEGYPGNRFHGGGRFADIAESAAIDRAKELFGCEYVNAQPHSGTQANQAVFFAALNPGARILSLDLAAGGHLSHGARANLSGRWFESFHYGVDRETGLIDYDAVARQARELQPKLLIGGGSAYPRSIDFARLREIADSVEALLLVDMAHFAGLVAAGVHPTPVPHADFVTCTTTKTLRGPRGGLILARDGAWRAKLQSAVFPGVQGSLHTQVIAAKAVCLGEALTPEFKSYGARVKANAATLAAGLLQRGVPLVSGGTDTHLVLLNLRSLGITGAQAEAALAAANITSNNNPAPFDPPKPTQWSGLRLGVSAATTRGFEEADFVKLSGLIADLVKAVGGGRREEVVPAARAEVESLCRAHPLYAD